MDIKTISEQLTSACNEHDLMLVNNLPNIEGNMAEVALTAKEMIGAIQRVHPKIVYNSRMAFDSEEVLLAELEVGDDEEETSEELLKKQSIRTFVKQWAKHNGEIFIWLCGFSHEGIFHSCIIEPEWKSEYIDAIDAIHDDASEIIETIRDKERAKRRALPAWLLDKATELANNKTFNSPKSSKEKRSFLAETLFPDLDQMQIMQVVERATNIVWLKSNSNEGGI